MAVSISIAITQNGQSIENNTSNITVKVTAAWTNGSWNALGTSSGTITIDGVKYSFTGLSFNTSQKTSGSEVVMAKTVNVTHKDDGTKTVSCSASFDTRGNSGTVTATGSKTMTPIGRATVPTVSSSSVDMGSAVTINTPRASSNFKHDLAYSFAGGLYVSIATDVDTSYKWTTPDLATQLPKATSGTVTIRCKTKNGGKVIGTETVTLTLKVPSTVVPIISEVLLEEAVSGLAAQFGAYIKSKSKIKAVITAAGVKGSTITSYSTRFQEMTYKGDIFTTGVVTGNGSMVVTVTDSRGRRANKTVNVYALDYAPPEINELHVYRVNASGDADDDGIYIAVKYKYSVTSLSSKNTASMVVEYKTDAETEWTQLLTSSALSADTTALPKNQTFSTDYQYTVRLSLSDYFGSANPYTAVLQSGDVIFDIRADGQGFGFFKTASRTGVDFGSPVKGAVLGLWEATAEIPENGDFNEYLQPGVYSVPRNDTMQTIANRPCDRAGTLRVSAGIGTKKISGPYAYIVQEFHPYHNTEPIYRRHLITDETGAFTYGVWRAITFRGQKILWEGGLYMTDGHQANLSEPVSKQDNGIVLVFSTYTDGAPVDANFNFFFVPKKFVEIMNGYGSAYQMNTVNFNTVGAKYLYIHDTYIKGNESNNLSGTASSGITFNNAMYVLRYVLGV